MQITSVSGGDISPTRCTGTLSPARLFFPAISFSTLCTLLEAIFTHESFTEASHPPSPPLPKYSMRLVECGKCVEG